VIAVFSPEATALRLVLAFADDGNDDALVETLREFTNHRCPGCQSSTVCILLDMLIFALDRTGINWETALQERLCEVLDLMSEAR
jgi:hypothetical protein